MTQRNVSILKRTWYLRDGTMHYGVERRRANPVEIRQLQAKFMRNLAKLVRETADAAWIMTLPNGWFVDRRSGFQTEFKRLGRRAERLLLDEARRLLRAHDEQKTTARTRVSRRT